MKRLQLLTVLVILNGIGFTAHAQFSNDKSRFALPRPAIEQIMNSPEITQAYSTWAIGQNVNQNTFVRIGNYKVKGTPYLFGSLLKSDIYTATAVGMDVSVAFDTYNQQLEIFNKDSKQSFVKTVAEVDSFVLKGDANNLITSDMRFISSRLIDSTKKTFLQELTNGKRFKLFKVHRSTLGLVNENIIQSELRQFDMTVEYYYTDTQNAGLKKLKVTTKALKNEFKEMLNTENVITSEGLKAKPQLELQKLFSTLN